MEATGLHWVAVIACMASSFSDAHGGGLDANGCHFNRRMREYHCHRGGYQPPAGNSLLAPPRAPSRAVPVDQIDNTCYTGKRRPLPGYLLYEVMNFPNKVASVKRYLNAAAELTGPSYYNYMEERQYEYSMLDVKVDHLASKRRVVAGFPSKHSECGTHRRWHVGRAGC